MGENLTGLYAAAASLALLCLSGTARAQAPSPIRDTGARGAIGAPGVVIRFEEATSSGVLYLEESGGMVSTIPPPVKAAPRTGTPAAPAKKEPAVAEAAPPSRPPAAPSKVAERRTLPPDGVAAKR